MAKPAEFARRLRKLARAAGKNINATVRQVALAIDQQVVTATPVDTGRARSNWQVSLDAPITITREPLVPGESGSTGSQNAQAAIAEAQQRINRRQPGHDIFISNSLPYIDGLNKGNSAQAPRNFVEIAVDAGLEELRRVRILEKEVIR